jgi:small subunit ribosomal protein S20
LANRHPSAIKRNRQNIKRQERNYAIRSRLRNEIRKVRDAVAGSDADAAAGALREAIKEISKAATKGVIHKNAASRRISRLSRAVAAARSSQQA